MLQTTHAIESHKIIENNGIFSTLSQTIGLLIYLYDLTVGRNATQKNGTLSHASSRVTETAILFVCIPFHSHTHTDLLFV